MNRRPGGAQNIPRPDAWRMGDAPAWQGRDLSRLQRFDDVQQRLSAAVSPLHVDPMSSPYWFDGARLSAVLVPLIETDGGPSVVLTRRAQHLRNHRGEVSFPGGRVENNESILDAALREAEEEIRLSRQLVQPLGTLEPLATVVSNSFITPVVGTVSPLPQLVPDRGEVERIFTVPLHELVRVDTYRNEMWRVDRINPNEEMSIHFFELDDETIWGATARMLHHMLDIITRD
jgi:8-oxo-dGTP pyrophosphatase MutT (NUDIX family)